MEQEKNINRVNLLLVFVTIFLAILCVLFVTGTISFTNNKTNNNSVNSNQPIDNDSNNSTIYTADSIEGVYSYVTDEMTDENGNKFTASYNLTLYANGLFEYRMATMAPFGYIGNYTINDNKITLNYLFGTTSGYGINVLDKEQTKEIVIDSDGHLIDVHQSMQSLGFDTVHLTKDNSKSINNNEILNKLYETAIFNKTTNN